MDCGASAITLIGAATCITKEAFDLYHSIEDAPKALTSISNTVACVPVVLSKLSQFDDEFAEDQESLAALHLALSKTRSVLQKIKVTCSHSSDENISFRRRLRWVLLERKEVTRLICELQNAQIELLSTLKPFELYVTFFNAFELTFL